MIISFNIELDHPAHKGFFFSWYNKITLNGKKIPAESYFGEKKFLQIVMLKKRNSTQKKLPKSLH